MDEDIEIRTEGEARDEILRHVLQFDGRLMSCEHLHTELFKDTDLSIAEVELLVQRILNAKDEIATGAVNEHTAVIGSTGLTKKFLDNGGFTQIFKEKASGLERQKELEQIELEKSRLDLELSRKMLQEYPWTKWISRIGFFLALGLALLELFKFLFDE